MGTLAGQLTRSGAESVDRNASDGFDHLWLAAADEADRSVVRNATSRCLVEFPQKIDSPNLLLKQVCRINEGEFADPVSSTHAAYGTVLN
jgi:hypothetical protein